MHFASQNPAGRFLAEDIVVIERWKLSDLRPAEYNPRVDLQPGDPEYEKIRRSIEEFGLVDPIIVNKDGTIIGGHQRYKILLQMGETETDVSVLDLDKDREKALNIALNKTGGDWDDEKLKELLGEIDLSGLDATLTGFDEDELKAMIGDVDFEEEASDDGYDFKDLVEHRASPGDIFQLGDHRLMCGDAASTEDADRLTGRGGVRARMVFTDPPYGVAIGDKNKALNSVQKAGRQLQNIIGDTLKTDELYDLLLKAFTNLREHAEDDCSYYVTSPQGGEIGLMMMMMMRDAGLEVRHNLIWEKNVATFSMRRLDYDYQHEPIFYTWTKKHNFYGAGKYKTTVWKFDKPRKCDLHPTMKPIELIGEALLNSSAAGDPVFDFFGGSGSTLIACEQLGRRCYMMEKDPKFVDVIINRWEEYTGKKAVKLQE